MELLNGHGNASAATYTAQTDRGIDGGNSSELRISIEGGNWMCGNPEHQDHGLSFSIRGEWEIREFIEFMEAIKSKMLGGGSECQH